jgi:hypothetical protein
MKKQGVEADFSCEFSNTPFLGSFARVSPKFTHDAPPNLTFEL